MKTISNNINFNLVNNPIFHPVLPHYWKKVNSQWQMRVKMHKAHQNVRTYQSFPLLFETF